MRKEYPVPFLSDSPAEDQSLIGEGLQAVMVEHVSPGWYIGQGDEGLLQVNESQRQIEPFDKYVVLLPRKGEEKPSCFTISSEMRYI